ARSGLRVAAAKLTGVSLMRDALSMLDAGAVAALTFNDVGIASTHAGVTVTTAKGIFNRLAGSKPDVIIAELGDGILGEYGVQDILRDAELTRVGAAYVMAAPDPVACWGATELMRREFDLPITAIPGPATDNEVGLLYITTGPRRSPSAWPPAGVRPGSASPRAIRRWRRCRTRASQVPRPGRRRAGGTSCSSAWSTASPRASRARSSRRGRGWWWTSRPTSACTTRDSTSGTTVRTPRRSWSTGSRTVWPTWPAVGSGAPPRSP